MNLVLIDIAGIFYHTLMDRDLTQLTYRAILSMYALLSLINFPKVNGPKTHLIILEDGTSQVTILVPYY